MRLFSRMALIWSSGRPDARSWSVRRCVYSRSASSFSRFSLAAFSASLTFHRSTAAASSFSFCFLASSALSCSAIILVSISLRILFSSASCSSANLTGYMSAFPERSHVAYDCSSASAVITRVFRATHSCPVPPSPLSAQPASSPPSSSPSPPSPSAAAP